MTMNCGCPENRRLTRRGFLGRAALVAGATALSGLVGEGLSTRLAFAAPAEYTGDTLVVLSLRGGFDGLSAVVPAGDPEYYRARPGIGVPQAQLVGGDGFFGLHPALAPLLPFWNDGRLAAVQAVGQADPTRSHFAALEEMERAAPGTSLRTGWIDRMLGVRGAASVFNGVAIGGSLSPRSMGGPAPDLALDSVDGFELYGESTGDPFARTLRRLYADAPPLVGSPALGTLDAVGATAAMKAAGYTPGNGAVYPDTSLGNALRDVARLIRAQVGLQVACVDYGDWDMHEGLGTAEAGQWMHDHLGGMAQALAAFATDLGTTGMAGVTLLTLSEFGRRVGENASGGVDHGHGNAVLVLGGGVAGGRVYGTWPGLGAENLDDGDLRGTTDYRAILGEVLQQRCGMGSVEAVFPGVAPGRLGLVRARA
jgi:uncharacterized protein (DUF1501 family)